MDFTRYRMSDGAITGHGACMMYDLFSQAREGELVLMGEALIDTLWYLPDGVKTPRPVLDVQREYTIAADGVDAVAFPLPAGSQVFCITTGEEWLNEDEFFISTEITGTMEYRIEPAFPYQEDVRVTIHAT